MRDPKRAKQLCSLLSPKPFPSQPNSHLDPFFSSVLGGGCFQKPFIPVVKVVSMKRNLKDDAERLVLGRPGLGWDWVLLSAEGNPLGYTLASALVSPCEPQCSHTWCVRQSIVLDQPTAQHCVVPGCGEHRQRSPAYPHPGARSPLVCRKHHTLPAPKPKQRESSCPLRGIPRQNETLGQVFGPQLC